MQNSTRATVIYKICTQDEWAEAKLTRVYAGSRDDRRDGFIHFSTREQLPATAAKHFHGQTGLMLVAVDAARLAGELRWEPSRGGQLFPHLYSQLDLAAVIMERPLASSADGSPLVPEDLA